MPETLAGGRADSGSGRASVLFCRRSALSCRRRQFLDPENGGGTAHGHILRAGVIARDPRDWAAAVSRIPESDLLGVDRLLGG
jgi:hypothetical protein